MGGERSARTHARAHKHTHTFPRFTQSRLETASITGTRGRQKKVSLELRLEGRQILSMSHREREIVPDGRTTEREGALSLELFRSVRNTDDASVGGSASA